MIRIYTNKEYLTQEFRSYVFPLLFDLHYLNHGRLDSYYMLVDSPESCDLAIFPIDITQLLFLRRKKQLDDFVNLVREYTTNIWIYSGGDIGNTVTYKDVTVFRLGGFRSKLNKLSRTLPSFIEDPLEVTLQREWRPLSKSKLPEIGFVGHAQSGLIKYLEEISSFIRWNLRRYRKTAYSDFQPFYPSGVKRANYLKILQNDSRLACNFILRSKYRAGATTLEERNRTTLEFFENIFDNCYTFCMRGHGNFSVRLYEVLALGRIPILVDTDCKLPLAELIDWESHAIICKAEEIKKLPLIIHDFHTKISEEKLVKLQESNRQLWLEKLSREAYFITMHDLFIKPAYE
ncbi:MAG: hypothetical protein DWP94_09990 [Flavobacterium sp.]|nr:MAG: hypothetical protein DWP94_09990 [Flavobacterium sp.]